MLLKEYQAKEILKQNKIKIPNGILLQDENDIKKLNFSESVLKPQVLHGGRAKSGIIKFADKSNIKQTYNELSKQFPEILVEEKIPHKKEYYLSITINRNDKCLMVIFSEHGGIDIEELSEKNSEKIIKVNINTSISMDIKNKIPKKICKIFEKLYRIMKKYDCELIEINPMTEDLIALDAKIIIDDNALFRQDIKNFSNSVLPDANFVKLDGDIGLIGNGAGLVMAVLDILNFNGLKPANFFDIGAGSGSEILIDAIKKVSDLNPKIIFINIFGGLTRCDEMANGIIEFVKSNKSTPLVIRLNGINHEEAKQMLKEYKIPVFDEIQPAVDKIKEMVK